MFKLWCLGSGKRLDTSLTSLPSLLNSSANALPKIPPPSTVMLLKRILSKRLYHAIKIPHQRFEKFVWLLISSRATKADKSAPREALRKTYA